MKIAILIAALAMCATPTLAGGSHRVSGYTKKDGSYVAPTRRTNPDGRASNNYSSKPNINPVSGRAGTRNPYPSKPRVKR